MIKAGNIRYNLFKRIFVKIKSSAVFFMIYFLAASTGTAQVAEKESILKAAFVYNFTKYIEWNTSTSNDFTIGILGNSYIYEPLIEIAATKTVNDKKIIVRRFNSPEEITVCDILFISFDNTYSVSSILSKRDKGTLTISESPGYAKMGTALNFVIVDDKLKFEANVKSINNEGLKASSQLLKLAIIVD